MQNRKIGKQAEKSIIQLVFLFQFDIILSMGSTIWVRIVLVERRGISVKEVKLSIKIKSSDMHHFLVWQNYRSFSGLFGVFCSTVAVIYLLCTFRDNGSASNIILGLIGALFLIVQPIQLKLSSVQKVQMVPMFKEPLEYTLNEEGIKVQQKEEEAQIIWEDVSKVSESTKSIFLYTSPISAFIFPKEQYPEQIESVKEIIREHVKEEKCKWKKS